MHKIYKLLDRLWKGKVTLDSGQIPEAFVILLAGNLLALCSWVSDIPVNAGIFTLTLAVLIYGYVGFRYRATFLASLQAFKLEWRKVGVALLSGLVLTLPPLIFFLFPVVVGSIDYTPIKQLSTSAFLLRVLVEVPLMTALTEELLFRQYLMGRFKTPNLAKTLLVNASIFTLWHLVVQMRTVLDTNLSSNLFMTGVAYIGGLLSVFVGGVVFGLVRSYTGSFLYSAFTHWLNVALMIVIIWVK